MKKRGLVKKMIGLAAGDPQKVSLASTLLTHLLSNVISNAFKYFRGKENPELLLYFKPLELLLSIKDYRLGITEVEHSYLFQPFFCANNVAKIKGAGLCLSTAKECVQMNKGSINGTAIFGYGSYFQVTFKKVTEPIFLKIFKKNII